MKKPKNEIDFPEILKDQVEGEPTKKKMSFIAGPKVMAKIWIDDYGIHIDWPGKDEGTKPEGD